MVTLVAVVSVTMGVPGGFGKAKKREIRELSFVINVTCMTSNVLF